MKTNNTEVHIIILSSGLKVVHKRDNSEVEYFGVAVNAGSRDDPEGFHGLAHFVEHVLFKGTKRRRSWHIINRMEACGGELNAYTTKETTVVYSVYPRGNFLRAAELIGDLLCHSVFPAHELDKEREVVADEIDQYRDMPSEAVFDDFEDLLFKDSTLGHNILGTTSELAGFNSDVCRKYMERNFTAGRMVVFYSGHRSPDAVARTVEKYFADLPAGIGTLDRRPPGEVHVFNETVNLDNHQSNTVIGTRIPSMFSPGRTTIALLANILGGPGMNSLLNVELRERRGLVYAVETATAFLTDTGLFTVYFGCDHEDTERCSKLVGRIISKIADGCLTPRFINMAKRQYLGQLTLTSDIRENSVMSMARSALYYGHIPSRQETMDLINAIDASDLKECAERLLTPVMSTLTLR